jgi:NitT/TauT family transport system permease protein
MKIKYFNLPLYVLPNRWDGMAFLLIFGVLALLASGAGQMHAPIVALEQNPISLDPENLPEYALRTVLRMFAAITVSLIFTFAFATIAAKSRRAGMIMIPILDILQSVPVLGFISFTVLFFLNLFPGNILGAELASIFACFTSQAWNMTFSLYQSLRTIPSDLHEVSRSFRFSAWQRFWRLEVPFAAPGLIWNMMMSMSGGWFFVVASEAITVGNTTLTLPGIGSYVALALEQQNLAAIGYAIVAMFLVIVIYDQLLFRPLLAWSEKFRTDRTTEEDMETHSWVLHLLQRTRALRILWLPFAYIGRKSGDVKLPKFSTPAPLKNRYLNRALDIIWPALVAVCILAIAWRTTDYIFRQISLDELYATIWLGFLTMLRIGVLIVLVSLIWIPIGVWIGLKPKLAATIQPLAQFLAAFPANLLFPVMVVIIVRWNLPPDIWLSPLLVLGTQWYILFNVIAGARAFPQDLRFAAANLHLTRWQWWRRVMLPGILPYYVTGAITASGASWNASIVAEFVRWGDTTLAANGLGSYIAQATVQGDYPRIVLGVAVMALFVILYNRLLWHRLYVYSERHLRISHA